MPYSQPDFRAEVRFLTPEEGGHTGEWGTVRQGYRCDVHWDADPSDTIWMIWPRFLDHSRSQIPDGAEVPQKCEADFFIMSANARPLLDQQGWLHDDATFHLTEGPHRVAACRVIRILRSDYAET